MSRLVVASGIIAAALGQTCGSAPVNSNLTIYACSGADPARFSWAYVPGEHAWGPQMFSLTKDPSTCLAVVGLNAQSNTPNVAALPCNVSDYRQGWTIQLDGTIVSSQDGNVMDVFNRETTPGTQVDTFGPNGQSNQQWTFNATTGLLITNMNGFCAGLC